MSEGKGKKIGERGMGRNKVRGEGGRISERGRVRKRERGNIRREEGSKYIAEEI